MMTFERSTRTSLTTETHCEDPGVKETPRRTSPELADRTVENLSLAAPPAVVFDKVSVMTTS
jgi:hypothetical protein